MTFLDTKHGLAAALNSGEPAYDGLFAHFKSTLLPTLAELLDAAAEADEIRQGVSAEDLMFAIGNLCAYRYPDDPMQTRRRSPCFWMG